MRTLAYIILALFVTFGTLISTPFMKTTVASEDIEWSWVNPYPQGNDLNAIAYGNGMFVATGDDGTILTSADGETWGIQNSGTSNYLTGAAWLGGKFWCVGNGVILNSADGVTWTNPYSGMAFTAKV